MSIPGFPTDRFCRELVRFMDAIGYDEKSLLLTDLVDGIRHVRVETEAYFDQDLPRHVLRRVNPARIVAVTKTIPQFVVYCWSRVAREVQVDISIFLSLLNLLDDDVNADPHRQMQRFWSDMFQGKAQKHPFWILMNAHLPTLLGHYGSFCSYNIMRCVFDFFEGCWIEQHNFQGYPGSETFPLFIRRLNSLGGAVGGTIFPASDFDEQALFKELSSVMAHISGPVAFINDLFSFYKEFNQDEANLVTNWCTVDGITVEESFERLANETIRSCVLILDLFKERDSNIYKSIQAFIFGYVSWHLGEQRYRLSEVYDHASRDGDGARFRDYFERAMTTGWLDKKRWLTTDEWSFRPHKTEDDEPVSHEPYERGVQYGFHESCETTKVTV